MDTSTDTNTPPADTNRDLVIHRVLDQLVELLARK